jgi:hypothetical protein
MHDFGPQITAILIDQYLIMFRYIKNILSWENKMRFVSVYI